MQLVRRLLGRQQIVKSCREAKEGHILLTTGTDTIMQTAAFIAAHLPPPLATTLPLSPTLPHYHTLSESTAHLSDQSESTIHLTDQSETSIHPSDQSSTINNQSEMTSTHPTDQSATTTNPISQSRTTVSDHVNQSSARSSRPQSEEVVAGPSCSKVIEEVVAGPSCSKVIILTGAFLPERFKDSNTDFNVGVAVGAMQGRLPPGVYVALGGRVWRWDHVTRLESGQFVSQ
ncbi:hypothetical protein ACOMHN_058047 [Nucella lapillus]